MFAIQVAERIGRDSNSTVDRGRLVSVTRDGCFGFAGRLPVACRLAASFFDELLPHDLPDREIPIGNLLFEFFIERPVGTDEHLGLVGFPAKQSGANPVGQPVAGPDVKRIQGPPFFGSLCKRFAKRVEMTEDQEASLAGVFLKLRLDIGPLGTIGRGSFAAFAGPLDQFPALVLVAGCQLVPARESLVHGGERDATRPAVLPGVGALAEVTPLGADLGLIALLVNARRISVANQRPVFDVGWQIGGLKRSCDIGVEKPDAHVFGLGHRTENIDGTPGANQH